APFSTSRRLMSMLSPPYRPAAHHARQALRLSGENEHGDAKQPRYAERIPELSSAKANPQNSDVGCTEHRHEEAVTACGRKAKNAFARHFRPIDCEQRQNDEGQRDKAEEDRGFPSPGHPDELGGNVAPKVGDPVEHPSRLR